ncbi:MAG: prolipoprotein diacylglyceryl transferase [Alphaproteobacteria bacterium]|nr:prolipoprotein diacylglyceryl transferase [Alphaproteobacteria bacterium]
MLPVIAFPAIDPVAIAIGPIAIRWYALAYIAGIVLGWRYLIRYAARYELGLSRRDIDDVLVWVTLGVILGGRLGYVLFYQPGHYADHPLEALYLWKGGMSFHGGLLGVIVALVAFARIRKVALLALTDGIACATPIGLFFGRIANFINGELYGRASEAPWAMVFPGGGPLARHPSQLYEAAAEGLILFVALVWLARRAAVRARVGTLTGAFLAGYALARIAVEFFREPDAHLGFLLAGTTMGQLLSLPVLAFGAILIARPAAGRLT